MKKTSDDFRRSFLVFRIEVILQLIWNTWLRGGRFD